MSSAANGSGSYFGWCWRLLCRTKPAMASQVDDPAPATQIEFSPVRAVVGRPTVTHCYGKICDVGVGSSTLL